MLDGWNSQVELLRGEHRRGVAKGGFERGYASSRRRMQVVSIFNPYEVLSPFGVVLGCETTKAGLEFLIRPLSLAVSLWMVPLGQSDRSTQSGAESLPNLGYELRPSVGNYVCGYAMMSKNLGYEDVSSFSGGGELRKRNKLDSLRESVDDGEDYHFALRGRQSGHEIHSIEDQGR